MWMATGCNLLSSSSCSRKSALSDLRTSPYLSSYIKEAKVNWKFETALERAKKENGRGVTYKIAHLLILGPSKKSLFH